MNSLILRSATLLLLPVLLVFSVILLLRGHNVPGGGFVGGLVSASAFALHAIAYGPGATRLLLRTDLHVLIGVGLACGFGSGVISLFAGQPFMTGVWAELHLEPLGFTEALKIGTPVLFDVGVYLTVVGVVLLMIFSLAEDQDS